MKRRDIMMGVGLMALGAAALGAQGKDHAVTPPPLEPMEIIAVAPSGEASVVEEKDPHLISAAHGRWALMAAFGSLMAAFVGAIGFNRVLNMISRGGRLAAKAATVAAKAPVKAAKVAAVTVGKTLKKPGRALLGGAAIGLFLIGSIALLDLQWKAGLAVGAATAFGSIIGFRRIKKSFTKQAVEKSDPVSASANLA